MRLSERVEELKGRRAIVRLLRLPDRLRIEECYDRISNRPHETRSISKIDHDALLAKLRSVGTAREMMGLTVRDMRLAASCLFESEKPLADNLHFLDNYLDALRSIRSRGATKRLIHAYCIHFDPNREGIRRIASYLRHAISSLAGRWEWPELQRRFRIFDPTQAPRQLAALTLDSKTPRAELKQVGLSGQLLSGGLSAHIFLSALKNIEDRLAANGQLEEVDRAIAWVQGDDGGEYFTAYRGALVNALLLPWCEREPEQRVRERIQSYLLETFDDPRIDGGAWLGTDDAAREVMIRWLAQATLEQFLRVVDRVAPKHQWDYRRAFWGAYVEKKVVGNAWVAFGSSGAQVATKISNDTGDKLMRRFATLGGAGADQAVLLLSIGDLIVADWSHNGRLRIWRRGNSKTPQFNLNFYSGSELRSDSDFDAVHLPPDGWQARTEAYIRRHTGIRLTEGEYMPRRRPR
jgi:hypothetical protein